MGVDHSIFVADELTNGIRRNNVISLLYSMNTILSSAVLFKPSVDGNYLLSTFTTSIRRGCFGKSFPSVQYHL